MTIPILRFAKDTGEGSFEEPEHLLGLSMGMPHKAHFSVDGGGMKALQMQPGDLQIMPAGLSHRVAWNDASFLLVRVPGNALHSLAEEMGLEVPRLQPRLQQTDPLIQQLLVSLADASLPEQSAGDLLRQQLETALLGQLLNRYCGLDKVTVLEGQCMRRHTLAPRRLRQVLEYIEVFCHTPITVDELATIAGVSRYHFVRGFKASIGESPYQLVIRRRLERAQVLLQRSDLSVGEIAHELGFSSQSHFSQAFRRRFGFSPQRYRQQL